MSCSGSPTGNSRLGLAEGWGKIHEIRFNQDGSCFVASTCSGIRIFNVEPLREKAHFTEADPQFGGGGVILAQMFYRSNLVAFVSGGAGGGGYSDNTLMIYDDAKKRTVLEFTFPQKVLNVKLKRDKIVIVTLTQIHLYSFPNKPKKIFSVETRENPRGLCELGKKHMIFPGYKTGSLQIVDLNTHHSGTSSAPVTVNAHKTELWCLALNTSGTMIATASKKGTLIRIWDTVRKCMLVELRRGSDTAVLYCINFSANDEWLCCSSDKGTVHIFALQDYRLNKRSALASIGVPGAYAGSQWSLANFTVPQEVACVCAFGAQGYIYAACLDGSFHKYHFSPDGICNQNAYDVFTELCENCDWDTMRTKN